LVDRVIKLHAINLGNYIETGICHRWSLCFLCYN